MFVRLSVAALRVSFVRRSSVFFSFLLSRLGLVLDSFSLVSYPCLSFFDPVSYPTRLSSKTQVILAGLRPPLSYSDELKGDDAPFEILFELKFLNVNMYRSLR